MTFVKELQNSLRVCEPGDIELWEGCSWRRFGKRGTMRTIIEPTNHPGDGWPDLNLDRNEVRLYLLLRNNAEEISALLKRLVETYGQLPRSVQQLIDELNNKTRKEA